jgi:hypothetical protein
LFDDGPECFLPIPTEGHALAAIEADLRAVERFFDAEASTLAAAIAATGYVGYPVPQRDRGVLFLRYRGATWTSGGSVPR